MTNQCCTRPTKTWSVQVLVPWRPPVNTYFQLMAPWTTLSRAMLARSESLSSTRSVARLQLSPSKLPTNLLSSPFESGILISWLQTTSSKFAMKMIKRLQFAISFCAARCAISSAVSSATRSLKRLSTLRMGFRLHPNTSSTKRCSFTGQPLVIDSWQQLSRLQDST